MSSNTPLDDSTRAFDASQRELRLDKLLAEYVEATERGEPPDREALLAANPDLATELREFFANRDGIEHAMGAMRPPSPPRGVLPKLRYFGDYELLEEVARGGMGIVYKARQTSLNRIVAVKMILAGQLATVDDVRRFRTEAEAAANLQHPNIVAVHEVGIHEDQHYFSMEFVEGQNLAALVRENPLPARRAAEYVQSIALAVHYAHQQGTLHRDLKPSNVLIDTRDQVRITDFGLATRVSGDHTLTQTGQVLGTPSYMAPEQAAGKRALVGPAADIYSLGVVLYELLTGRPPFRAESAIETLHQVIHVEPASPRLLNPHIPRDLETICLKCLEKEPYKRYGTAELLAEDLRRFIQGVPICARPVSQAERLWRWCRRNPVVSGLAASVATLLLAVGVGAILTTWHFRAANERLETTLYTQRIALAHRELNADPPNIFQAEGLLQDCRADLRGWEWHYLKRRWRIDPVALQAPGSKEVNSVAFSPDGNYLAAACGDHTVKVWNLKSRQVLATLRGHAGNVVSVAFHPTDSQRLASASMDRTVRVWDLGTQHEVFAALPGQEGHDYGMAYSVAFSPDGQRLATCSEGATVKIWDATTGQLIHTLPGHEAKATNVAFSSDGKLIASGSFRGVVRIWDAMTGRIRRTLTNDYVAPLGALAFSPDSRQLVVGKFNQLIERWDPATGQQVGTLSGPRELVFGLAFAPDGRRLASTGTDSMHLWDAATGQETLHLHGHATDLRCIAFSPDGQRLASSSQDHSIRIWDATPLEPNEGQELLTFREHTDRVRGAAYSHDGRHIASASFDKTVRLWDAATGQMVWTYAGIHGGVFSLAVSPDGQRLAAAGYDESPRGRFVVKFIDPRTGKEEPTEVRADREIFHATFSPDGQWLALGSGDGSVTMVNARTGNEKRLLGNHDREVLSLVFMPDGHRLASVGGEGTLKVWDLMRASEAPQPVLTLGGPDAGLYTVACSPDSRHFLTGSRTGVLTLWDAATGQQRHSRRLHAGVIRVAAFSADGQWAASAGLDCAVRIWDPATLQPRHTFRGHLGDIGSLAFSPDSRRLVSSSRGDHTAKVWDLTGLQAKTTR